MEEIISLKTISLDQAIREAAEDIESRLESGVIIALLNFSSPSEGFSEYVLEDLSAYLVRSENFTVVERNKLDIIRQEEQFQLSGEVSDESAQAIGKKLGAQVVVSGSLSDIGTSYRFRIKTLTVETAAIAATMFADINIQEERVVFLLAGAKPVVEQLQENPIPEGLLYEVVEGTITITKYIGNDTNVNIPASIDGLPVTIIGDRTFFECKSLTNVSIPSSVTTIGVDAFTRCYSLTSISLPSSITAIGDNAFLGCNSLISVTIPSSVTSIGNMVFYGCSSLTSVTISSSVTSIGNMVFYGCSNLTNISVDTRNSVFTSVGGVLLDKSGRTLIYYPAGKSGAYTIPLSVTTIGVGAFEYCLSLTSVTIPSSIIIIEKNAFSGCDSLTSVTIPFGVTAIGDGAFQYCHNLTSVTIPSTVTTIGNNAFSSTKLTDVILSRRTVVHWSSFASRVEIQYRE